jgi:DnaK suppressor protein
MNPKNARRALPRRKAVLDQKAGTAEKKAVRDSGRENGASSWATEIDKVQTALQRMDQGTWGACDSCHGAIGRQRLKAVPEARLCATCSLELERRRPRNLVMPQE